MDEARKRLSLTHKKTLIDSELPILADWSDAQIGLITHAVVFKVLDKYALVEFYNNLQALIPFTEVRSMVQSVVIHQPLTSFEFQSRTRH